VIAPAKTGSLVTSKIAVIITAQINKGRCPKLNTLEERAQKIVLRKLIAPRMDLAPAT
jgi:hypothetical protein